MSVNIRRAGMVDVSGHVPPARRIYVGREVVPEADDAALVSGSVGEDDRKPGGACKR